VKKVVSSRTEKVRYNGKIRHVCRIFTKFCSAFQKKSEQEHAGTSFETKNHAKNEAYLPQEKSHPRAGQNIRKGSSGGEFLNPLPLKPLASWLPNIKTQLQAMIS